MSRAKTDRKAVAPNATKRRPAYPKAAKVRVHRPEALWLAMVASRLSAASKQRERAFRLVLEGKFADDVEPSATTATEWSTW